MFNSIINSIKSLQMYLRSWKLRVWATGSNLNLFHDQVVFEPYYDYHFHFYRIMCVDRCNKYNSVNMKVTFYVFISSCLTNNNTFPILNFKHEIIKKLCKNDRDNLLLTLSNCYFWLCFTSHQHFYGYMAS